jgi:hypothetical protein
VPALGGASRASRPLKKQLKKHVKKKACQKVCEKVSEKVIEKVCGTGFLPTSIGIDDLWMA